MYKQLKLYIILIRMTWTKVGSNSKTSKQLRSQVEQDIIFCVGS